MDESFSAGTKSGTPLRAQAPRIDPGSFFALSPSRARNAREESDFPASESANCDTARSVFQYFSSSMNVSYSRSM